LEVKNMAKGTRSITIRIDPELLDKLHVVANYEGRSANSQVVYLIRKCVERFEQLNGAIDFSMRRRAPSPDRE